MSWVHTKFATALKFYNGKAGTVNESGAYPVYGSNGIIGYCEEPLFENAIIIGRVGAYCGAVQYCKGKFWASDNTIVVKANAGYDVVFLSYLLHIMNLNQFAGGSAQPLLTHGWIKPIAVKMPLLPIQQKIAGILAAYDDLIENNLKRIKLLEEMVQITYEEWFVRLRFPGHEATPINPETGLPQGWSKTKLKAVLTLNYGKALKADTRLEGDIPVYGSSGIVGAHNEALVKGCGIIVGRKGNVGSVFWSHDSFYPIDTVYFVTSKHALPFLYFALKNSKFNNSDAAVPGLNRDAAYAVEIMLPPDAIEKEFSEMGQQNFKAIQILEMQNQRLREARDILLPRLMTGVIDVENYDPAQLLKEAA